MSVHYKWHIVKTYRLRGWMQLASLFTLIFFTSKTGGSEGYSAGKQESHFFIDSH